VTNTIANWWNAVETAEATFMHHLETQRRHFGVIAVQRRG